MAFRRRRLDPLIDLSPFVASSATFYDIMRTTDGERFLLIQPAEAEAQRGSAAPKIHVVLNWLEELKTRVPVP